MFCTCSILFLGEAYCDFGQEINYVGRNKEFKKLRWRLQRKRHIAIGLCVWLSVLLLFQIGHVVQNKRRVLSRAWHEWFSCKGKEPNIYCWELAAFLEALNWNFKSSFGRLRQKFAPKSVPHVQDDYFSSLNQSNHWFVTLLLSLPSSLLLNSLRMALKYLRLTGSGLTLGALQQLWHLWFVHFKMYPCDHDRKPSTVHPLGVNSQKQRVRKPELVAPSHEKC